MHAAQQITSIFEVSLKDWIMQLLSSLPFILSVLTIDTRIPISDNSSIRELVIFSEKEGVYKYIINDVVKISSLTVNRHHSVFFQRQRKKSYITIVECYAMKMVCLKKTFTITEVCIVISWFVLFCNNMTMPWSGIYVP